MKAHKYRKPYELGRRLIKGPRQVDRPPATLSEKSATRGTLNILQINISGLSQKTLELSRLLHKNNIHVLLLQETLIADKEHPVPGYTMYKCVCQKCRGIATLLRKDIQGEVKNLVNNGNDIQEIHIWHHGSQFTLFNAYCPPKSKKQININITDSRKTIIAGDFNAHMPVVGYKDKNTMGNNVEELCNTSNLIILQDTSSTPTLLHRASGSTFRPDLTIVSADLQNDCKLRILDDIGSDHRPILLQISQTRNHQPQKTPRWNYRKADWEKFKTITDENLTTINENTDINTLYNSITKIILGAAYIAIPRGCRQKYSPFWTKTLEELVKNRRAARKKAEKFPTRENRTEYNRLTALIRLETKKAKQQKWSNTCSNLNLRTEGKKAWKLLNNLSGKNKQTNPKPLRTSNQVLVEDTDKANSFNKFFSDTSKTSQRKVLDKALGKVLKNKEKSKTTILPLFQENFTFQELQIALKKLQPRKAPGPDKISNEMIHHLGATGKTKLLNFINMTWQNGTLPKAWKTAIVRPILKTGKPEDDIKSFRPISLTSNISKLAERMLNNRLYWWLESTNSLNNFQAGFRKGARTEDQLFLLTQSMKDGFQLGKSTVAVFVDLQQAYDKVWRKGLLLKMQNMGICGKMYNWIKNYLSDRSMQTQVNNKLSSKRTLEGGLPQGSALSCTLFLIYINDLPDLLATHKAMFADDLVIWTSGSDLHLAAERLRRALLTISVYCNFWKLKINTSKTTYTIFTLSNKLKKTKLKFTLDGAQINREENPTYLGVQLDRKLTFNNFMNNIAEKASKRLNLLKRLASTSWGADKTTLRHAYIGYIRSILDYNLPLQATASKTTHTRVDRVQSQALHFICGGMRSTPTAACEIDANIEPLDIRREKATIEAVERFKRLPQSHPNKVLVNKQTRKIRLKQKSPVLLAEELNEKHHLPEDREETERVSNIPPNTSFIIPQINTTLMDSSVNKATDYNILKLSAMETIDSYPKGWIHAYTDGSAFKATINAGYGSLITFPDKTQKELSAPCGEFCTNYDAEVHAISETLSYIITKYKNETVHPENLVIFSDSVCSTSP